MAARGAVGLRCPHLGAACGAGRVPVGPRIRDRRARAGLASRGHGPCGPRGIAVSPRDWTFWGIEAVARERALSKPRWSSSRKRSPPNRSVLFLPIHPDALRRGLRAQRDGMVATAGGRLVGLITASADEWSRKGCGSAWSWCAEISGDAASRARCSRGCSRGTAARPSGSWRAATPSSRPGSPAGASCRSPIGCCSSGCCARPSGRAGAVARVRGRVHRRGPARRADPIERHGDRLISKTRDMRDLLLAASETEFFTRHHDGRGRFERDARGRVDRLVIREGQREFVAIRE